MNQQSSSRGVARIGLLVPFTNVNLEADMSLMRPDGVSFHSTRLGGYDEHEIPDADQMAGLGASSLDEPLELLTGTRPDLIMYGCTSATLTHGPAFDRQLAAQIKDMSGAQSVTAAGALVHGLKHLGISRIAFASPYTPDINQAAMDYLTDCGAQIVSSAAVTEQLDNTGQGDLTPQDVFDLGKRAVGGGEGAVGGEGAAAAAAAVAAEALVLSCTEMRSVEAINALENDLDIPVVTSNQAMLFEAMQKLDLPTQAVPFGRLFKTGAVR